MLQTLSNMVLCVKVALSALWNDRWEYQIFSPWTTTFCGILNKKVHVTLADDTRRAQDADHSSLRRNCLQYSLQCVAGG